MLAVIEEALPFVVVKAGVFPEPLPESPMLAFEFIQPNVPPVGTLVNVEAAMIVPPHVVMFDGTVTVGVGLTVIEYAVAVPAQVFAVGVTVIVEVIGAFVEFVPVNDPIFPEPLAANPIDVFEFVQA